MNEIPVKISSPCLSICQVDGRAKICIGCGRELREIGMWSRLSEEERLAIMEKLPARLDAFRQKQ